MNRRGFLTVSAHRALGLSVVALAGCAYRNRGADSNATSPWGPLISEFEARIPELMADAKVPGLSVAVIHDARIVWRRAFGFANASTRTAVDHNTVFQAASMSKPVFAYAALKLCERGVMGLDTPLTRYTPQPFLADDPRLELITARHVLSHSSGLPNWRSGEKPLKTLFDPGAQYLYSGEGYYYLQSIITHLTGKVDRNDCAPFEAGLEVCASDIDRFMLRNLLVPFGMLSSGYLANRTTERHVATGHDLEGKPLPRVPPTGPSVARYAAAGALLTTPTDYARFMIEVLKPGEPGDFRLSKDTVGEMLRPHVTVVDGPYTSSWGLGWQIQNNGLINHGGDNQGFHCHAIASPKLRSGFVVMTNGDNGPIVIQRLFALPAVDSFFGLQKENLH